jgi:hypothetical protein
MKNHLKTWASGVLLTLGMATFCWTARADLQVYTNDTGLITWDLVGGSAPFYTAVSSANLSAANSSQGQPGSASGSTPYTVLSETFTITNGAGSLVVGNTNYLLTSIGVMASFGTTNFSMHIFDVTTNLTSNNGTPLQGSGATYNFTANGDLLGGGIGLTFSNPVSATRQTIFNLTTGPGTQDQIVLGARHSYAFEFWSPVAAGSAALTWNRTPGASPSDPGGEAMGGKDSSTSLPRLTITSLGSASGAPRTFTLALYGTVTSQAPTVNTNIITAPTTNYIVDTFAPAGVTVGTNSYNYSGGGIGALWTNWFGTAFLSTTWDANSDANGSASSGSLLITAAFDDIGDDQFVVFDKYNGIVPPLNGLGISSFQCDIRFDGSSPVTTNGGVGIYGHLQFGTRTPDYLSQGYFGSIEVQAGNTSWVHVTIPINAATDTNLTSINDVIFHLYGPYYSPVLNGTTKLWVDNIKFVGPAGFSNPPPPTLGRLQPVVPALRIFAGSTAHTYDRQNIATVSQNAGWYNNNPGTYSITFTNFPGPAYQGFEFHVFFVPVNSLPASYGGDAYGNTFVDYDSANVAALRIVANTTNYTATFSYKTNTPGANPNITLGTISTPTAVGTWTLSFSGNTSVTLSGPGTNTTFSMNDASAFANPVVAYFGVQPNLTSAEGQYVDVTEIKVGPAQIDDVFSTDSIVDPGTWTPVAVAPGSIWIAGTGTGGKYWLNWSIPDIGFGLAESTNLTAGTGWVLPSFFNGHTQNPVQALEGTAKWALIPTNCVPANPKSLFFVLRNPAVTN